MLLIFFFGLDHSGFHIFFDLHVMTGQVWPVCLMLTHVRKHLFLFREIICHYFLTLNLNPVDV